MPYDVFGESVSMFQGVSRQGAGMPHPLSPLPLRAPASGQRCQRQLPWGPQRAPVEGVSIRSILTPKSSLATGNASFYYMLCSAGNQNTRRPDPQIEGLAFIDVNGVFFNGAADHTHACDASAILQVSMLCTNLPNWRCTSCGQCAYEGWSVGVVARDGTGAGPHESLHEAARWYTLAALSNYRQPVRGVVPGRHRWSLRWPDPARSRQVSTDDEQEGSRQRSSSRIGLPWTPHRHLEGSAVGYGQ